MSGLFVYGGRGTRWQGRGGGTSNSFFFVRYIQIPCSDIGRGNNLVKFLHLNKQEESFIASMPSRFQSEFGLLFLLLISINSHTTTSSSKQTISSSK